MKGQKGRNLAFWMAAAVLAAEMTMLVDVLAVICGMQLRCSRFLLLFVGITAGSALLFRRSRKTLTVVTTAVTGAICVTAGMLLLGWHHFSRNAVYRNEDEGKAQLYSGQRVMLIVPHQDDEINVLGGVMEEYVHYGSQLYPVFVTNGDYETSAETRFAETVAVFEHIGVPAENLYFLGYGDSWAEDGPHIYNAEPGEVVTSHCGRTATYGTAAHGVFREGNAYTVDNLLQDLQDVITTCRPDVIYCVDYDDHIDHKASSLAFEKVMGRILKQEPDYRPVVYKGYAYNSAWYAEPDFYETNILSTQNVYAEPYLQQPETYRWEDRIRLPVRPDTLSRSLYSSDTYYTLSLHSSQKAHHMAQNVINGDKVVWHRSTASLCYAAQIRTSSSDPAVLNDFMLLDNHALTDKKHMPYDGVWIPEGEDREKSVQVSFREPQDVYTIVLYDHPSEQENVLDARIVFDDGTEVCTGPLHPGGAASAVTVKKNAVREFTVFLSVTEGENAGLSEIEAFSNETQPERGFIKIMNEAEDFCYDYWIDPSGTEILQVYTCGIARNESTYTVHCDNDDCSAEIVQGEIHVRCPVGEETTVTAACARLALSDSIHVENPGKLKRLTWSAYQELERFGREIAYQKTACYILVTTAQSKLETVAEYIMG